MAYSQHSPRRRRSSSELRRSSGGCKDDFWLFGGTLHIKVSTFSTSPVATPPSLISGSYEHRLDPKTGVPHDVISDTSATSQEPLSTVVNWCSGCRKKVGLTGFRCRCGEMFCSEHRYSDRHDCDYDYKAAGRDVIARENPMVRAAKILKV